MKIVVLAGGLSPERDVSLVSASKIAKALINKGHKVFVLDLYKGVESIDNLIFCTSENQIKEYKISENAPETEFNGNAVGPNVIECLKKADVTYLALHGDVGENGKIQALLDLNNIKYTGSGCLGCALSMDKNISKMLVKQKGFETAKWCINEYDGSMTFPLVIKPSNGGSSIGVSIAENYDELNYALANAIKYDSTVLIEEKIEGTEVSVGILDNRVLPVIEILPKEGFYDYRNKYQAGSTVEICPANLSAEITQRVQHMALEIHNLLHLKFYSRIDFIIDKMGVPYFLEANALPGMTPTSLLPQEALADGILYDDLCEKIAQNGFDFK